MTPPPRLDSNPISCAVIGGGMMGAGRLSAWGPRGYPQSHAQAYLESAKCELSAIVEVDESRRCELKRRLPDSVKVYGEIEDLEELPYPPQVICVSTPTVNHLHTVEQVVQLRPSLMAIEKPVGRDVTEARRIIELCEQQNIAFVPNYSRRYAKKLANLLAELKAAKYGRIHTVHCIYSKGLRNNGAHLIDMLLTVFGCIEVVSSQFVRSDDNHEDPDVTGVLLGDGSTSIHLGVTDHRYYAVFECEFFCDEAAIKIQNLGHEIGYRFPEVSSTHPTYNVLGKSKTVKTDLARALTNYVKQQEKMILSKRKTCVTGQAERMINIHQVIDALIGAGE